MTSLRQMCTSVNNMAELDSAISEETVAIKLNNEESNEDKALKRCDEYWQSCHETIRERNCYMFMNELMSDVGFSVGLQEDESENVIPAHKYVLAISSPVFYAMFYGELAVASRNIEISDTTYECFVEFMRFLYCDETKLTIDCVMGVSYLAKKYIVPALEKKCIAFVEEVVKASNVFKLLSLARSHKDDFAEKVCWGFLDSDTLDSLESAMFCEVDKAIIEELLTRDTLHAKEIDLFLALRKWAAAQHDAEEEKESEEAVKETIKDVVNLIRYPLMSQREFAEHVAKSKLLQHEDVINMFLKFNDTLEDDDTVLPFSQVPRRGYYRCSLYQSLYDTHDTSEWDVEISKTPNILTFTSNSNILLCGVGLYGNDNKGDSYTFNVHVSDEDNQVLLSSEGSFSCHAQCLAYDVIFTKPVKIHKNIWYNIHGTVIGPRSVYGGECVATETIDPDIDEIMCDSVKFLFKDIGSRHHHDNMYNHFSGLLYFLH